MAVPARINIVTLGVADLERSAAFYDALGWRRSATSSEAIVWFATAGSVLGLFPYEELASDATLAGGERSGFGGITLAINVDEGSQVQTTLEAAAVAVVRSSSPPRRRTRAACRATSLTSTVIRGRWRGTRSSHATNGDSS